MKTNSKKFSIKDWFEKNKLYILSKRKNPRNRAVWRNDSGNGCCSQTGKAGKSRENAA